MGGFDLGRRAVTELAVRRAVLNQSTQGVIA